jgi:hypothetical protein
MMPPRDRDWRYWLATDVLLIGGLAGWPWGMLPVIGLTIVQGTQHLAREQRVTAFPVQVRLGYLLLLLAGLYPPLAFIHWIQLAGTTAVVTVGYCPLARLLALMPWNRDCPLTLQYVRRTIFSPPVAGSILGMEPGE